MERRPNSGSRKESQKEVSTTTKTYKYGVINPFFVCRRVKIMGDDEKPTPIPAVNPRAEGNLVSAGNLCKIITDDRHSQLQLVVSRDGHVVSQPDKPCLDAFILDRASISLAELLQFFNSQLLNSHRILLLYVLAKSFWQLYDSEWMRNSWTKDDIHFMVKSWSDRTVAGRFERKSVIYLCEPFLSTPFKCYDKTSKSSFHPFPKILALGIIFLEVLLGQGLENWPEPGYFLKDIPSTLDADFYIAERAFEEARERNGSVAHMGQLIKRCISPTYFLTRCKKNVESLREAIQKDIVNVLHASYNDFDSEIDPDATSTVKISLSTVEASVTPVEMLNYASSSSVSERLSSVFQKEPSHIAALTLGGLHANEEPQTELVSRVQFMQSLLKHVPGHPNYQ